MKKISLGAAVVLLICVFLAPQDARATAQPGALQRLTLTSPDFADGGPLPDRTTCRALRLGNSPALSWAGVPEGTQELELIVHDPEAVTGDFDHWVVHGIPTTTAGSTRNHPPAGSRVGLDSALLSTWFPPCAPSAAPHHYVFTLYASDALLRFDLPPTASQVRKALVGHVLATSEIVGTFALLSR